MIFAQIAENTELWKCANHDNSSSSSSGTISTLELRSIIERLKLNRIRDSTRRNFYSVWRQFNNFFLQLDHKPEEWEDRITLFVGYLIEKNKKAQTVKSYLSAMKAVLAEDKIKLDPDTFLLSALTRACKFKNDYVKTRLPIHKHLLMKILQEAKTYFGYKQQQPYLEALYSAMISTAYFGLFRIGELASGSHPIMVTDVSLARNKRKILFVLRSSKMLTPGEKPQTITVSSTKKINSQTNYWKQKEEKLNRKGINYFCPYQLIRNYLAVRPGYIDPSEPFFVFIDNSPVKPENVRLVLKTLIARCGFNSKYYFFHGLRTGCASDMLKIGISVETIKKLGRWRSNAVFMYLRNL